jgi:hypothetical protein
MGEGETHFQLRLRVQAEQQGQQFEQREQWTYFFD